MRRMTYFLYELLFLVCPEWILQVCAYGVNDATERPYVHPAVITLSLEHFWRLEKESSHVFDYRARILLSSASEISDLNEIVLAFQKYVAWLEISMNDLARMEVFEGKQYFQNELLDSHLR